MKSHLSSVLPTHQAAEILGQARVRRIMTSWLRLKQPTPNALDDAEVDLLFRSLFYNPANEPIPPTTAQSWKQWLGSRAIALDKQALLHFLVPAQTQPHAGAGGHMGLFDCWVYALQPHAPTSTATYYGGAAGSLVHLPDVLILLATCYQYQQQQQQQEQQPEATIAMARLAYRIYDSYQKKGVVARDTVHRFMTDVFGEDSYKRNENCTLLDQLFATEETTNINTTHSLQATVTENIFVQRLQQSKPMADLLLGWMATLGTQMIPLHEEIPPSIAAYLDTMTAMPQPICELYQLDPNTRLFEIKRRFHSLVQSSNPVIQGDLLTSEETLTPKQSISPHAFVQAISTFNQEMGHGGYLPTAVAQLVFDSNKEWWTLYHVLQFGCIAVRGASRGDDADGPLLRFLFQLFQKTDFREETDDPRVLVRKQIRKMVHLLCEYADFRIQADAPPSMDDYDDDMEKKLFPIENEDEEEPIDASIATLLDLVPPSYRAKKGKTIETSVVVEYIMEHTAVPGEMNFEEFREWNNASKARLEPLMMELRLIASTVFGIPPTCASMEIALIAEIERRHKARYPQTSMSRRGPRGTVWYLIDASWLKAWTDLVQKVSGTSQDGIDVVPGSRGVRGLPRINNAGLLAENGSLALRKDLRWKHDYEILPPLAWHALQAWYDGGPPIHRSVVKYVSLSGPSSPHSNRSRIPTENEIELYPFFVTIYLCDMASKGEARPFQQNYQWSRVTPVGIMLVQLCKELSVDPELARLWVLEKNSDTPLEENVEDWILELDQNIVEQRKRRSKTGDMGSNGITLLLELKDEESQKWPRGIDGKDWIIEKPISDQITSELGDGVVGLYNMGNTCYMNTSIQCLGNTPILREYFTSKAYLRDINATNPLGHQGHLAQVSAVLINTIWKKFNQTPPGHHHQPKRIAAPGSYVMVNAPAITPKTFKESLGKFNDHFQGNEQHDAQELMAFLLDGLSEDLNRVVEKPYIEAPDSDGRPDGELADIWWSNHLKREFSIIVALFAGQYKSLLTCRTCRYESARYEPFTVLQLPLPEDEYLAVSLVLYPLREGVDIMRYCVRVPNDGRLKDVLVALAKLLDSEEKESTNMETGSGTMTHSSTRRAEDLVVVDLRDSYIAKIAPTSWSLRDLQNKESGELPLLHIYELDPTSDDDTSAFDRTNGDGDGFEAGDANVNERGSSKGIFIAVAQRRSEVTSRDHLHPLAHRVFGTPILLRFDSLDNLTGRDLYDIVAQRLKNVVPKGALRFLTNTQERRKENGTSTLPADTTQYNVRRPGFNKTTTSMEEVSAGPVPRYGFRLRLTTRDGRRCLICPWFECCIGCLIADDDNRTILVEGDSVVVDWHFAVDVATSGFGMRSGPADPISVQASLTRPKTPIITIKNHSSYSSGGIKGGQSGAITLEQCLDCFAQEEKIPEAYCSKCKDFRVQTKRMSLWRLPPILVIQLKRFQFTQHMRRKLRDLVVFPVEGLDMSRILAKETESMQTEKNENVKENGDELKEDKEARMKDCGRAHMLYDLYAVIHHQGALSGGHYVASIKSELDGQWRLFNDAQIFEIHPRDAVDSSAYILFYIRRDVVGSKLPDFWDVREKASLSQEDMDELLKGRSDRCVIS